MEEKKFRNKPIYIKGIYTTQIWKKLCMMYLLLGRDLDESAYLLIEQYCFLYQQLREANESLYVDKAFYKASGYIKKNPAFDVFEKCQSKLLSIMVEMKITPKAIGLVVEEESGSSSFFETLKIEMGKL